MLICHGLLPGRVSSVWLPAVPHHPRHGPGGGEEPGQDDRVHAQHQGRVHGPGEGGGPGDRVSAPVRAPHTGCSSLKGRAHFFLFCCV